MAGILKVRLTGVLESHNIHLFNKEVKICVIAKIASADVRLINARIVDRVAWQYQKNIPNTRITPSIVSHSILVLQHYVNMKRVCVPDCNYQQQAICPQELDQLTNIVLQGAPCRNLCAS